MKALGTAFVLLLAASSPAFTQVVSLNRAGSGARAAGMGNAFMAIADDGTAASWNPAGLSQLRQPEFSLVHAAAKRRQFLEGFRTLDRSAAFTDLKTTTNSANIEFASAALPFTIGSRPVTVQLGWRRLYQFSDGVRGITRRVPISAESRPEGAIRFDNASDGSVDIWALAGAVRLTSRLSLGVSADFYHGEWEDRVNLSEDPGIRGPTDFISRKGTNEIGDHTISFGLLLAYPAVKVGLVYHRTLHSGYDLTQFERSSLNEAIDRSFSQAAGYQLRFPRSVGLGVAWVPRPLLRFAVDLTYDEWKKFLVRAPNGLLSGFDGLPPGLTSARNTVTLNAGVERLFQVDGRYVPLRLGFSREPQGGRDPMLRVDANQTILAAGSGVNTNSLKFDVSIEYRWGGFDHTTDISPVYWSGRATQHGLPAGPEAQGTTRIQEWRLKVSTIYRVADTERIREVVRKAIGS
jgi:long-chain fatty acid transport protein